LDQIFKQQQISFLLCFRNRLYSYIIRAYFPIMQSTVSFSNGYGL
jgi:hypothetical protein